MGREKEETAVDRRRLHRADMPLDTSWMDVRTISGAIVYFGATLSLTIIHRRLNMRIIANSNT